MKALSILKDVFLRMHFYQYDYFCQTNTARECLLLLKSILSSEGRRRDDVIKYEKLAAEVMGAKYAVSFAAGRHALYAILKAIDCGAGDEVVCQAFTCAVVPRAVMYAGAVPVYSDISPASYSSSGEDVGKVITDRTKVVIVQHTFGHMANILSVLERIDKTKWKKVFEYFGANNEYYKTSYQFRNHIYTIEDFAHAIGNGKLVGDVGFYSSDHTKAISTYIGGMAFTNSAEIYQRLIGIEKQEFSWMRQVHITLSFIVEILMTHPRIYWLLRPLRVLLVRVGILFTFKDENRKEKPAYYPASFPSMLASVGISQLKRLPYYVILRKRYWSGRPVLRGHFNGTDDRVNGMINSRYKGNKYFVKGCWFNSPVFGAKNLSEVGYKEGSCPVAENVCRDIVNYPIPMRYDEYDKEA